ncbi:hypothetical protein [Methylohalobius crimeensis]|uniref:hypothetical protein n=1 Tax=Methylohalobius crimeensis TaxID=244365 RepID=UPI0003B64024|nr:hypothetical protein [Methylohalobius crimeensis]
MQDYLMKGIPSSLGDRNGDRNKDVKNIMFFCYPRFAMNKVLALGAGAGLIASAAMADPIGPTLLTGAEMDRISAGGVAVVTANATATSPIIALTNTNTAAVSSVSNPDSGISGSAVGAGGGAIAVGIGEGSTTETSVEPIVHANNSGSKDGTMTISLGSTTEVGFLEISSGAAVEVGIVGLGYFP